MREFSEEARKWLSEYHGSIDATALLIAYDEGYAAGSHRAFFRGYDQGRANA